MGNTACRGRLRQVQHFRLGNFAKRPEFWNWFNGNRRLHRHSMFTDEVQCNQDGTNNTILMCCQVRNLTLCERQHSTTLQCQCVLWSSGWSTDWSFHLRGSSYRRGEPVISARRIVLLELLLFHVKLDISLNDRFPGRQIRSDRNWPATPPDLNPVDYCVSGWLKEMVYDLKVGTRDAWLGRTASGTFIGNRNEKRPLF